MNSENKQIKIAIVDDHTLFRNAMKDHIHQLSDQFKVIFETGNGNQLFDYLEKDVDLDIVLMDLDMPEIDGIEVTKKLFTNHPEIPVLILTMDSSDRSLILAVKAGAKGYLGKDVKSSELKNAIHAIVEKGSYYTDVLTGNIIRAISNSDSEIDLTPQEMLLLEYCCSELTYKEIADQMNLSPKTIDGYRTKLFEKTNSKSRVGLVLFALKNRLVTF